jgi:hypothetical protein
MDLGRNHQQNPTDFFWVKNLTMFVHTLQSSSFFVVETLIACPAATLAHFGQWI